MRLPAHFLVFRAERLLRAANRERRHRLASDLAAYTSEADLNDLHALLDTYPDTQTQEIRQILRHQQQSRTPTHRCGGLPT